MKLLCIICGYEIAAISDLAFPIQGAMFTSKDPKHKFPAPWSPVVTWEHMYCPMCQKRAVLPPHDGIIGIKTDKGIVLVSKNAEKVLSEKPQDEPAGSAGPDVPEATPNSDVGQAEKRTEPVKAAVKPTQAAVKSSTKSATKSK